MNVLKNVHNLTSLIMTLNNVYYNVLIYLMIPFLIIFLEYVWINVKLVVMGIRIL